MTQLAIQPKNLFSTSVLALSLSLALTACGGGGDSGSSDKSAVSGSEVTKNDAPVNKTPDNTVNEVDTGSQPTTEDSNSDTETNTVGCDGITQKAMIDAINAARSEGRYCGTSFYPAVSAVTWNGYLAVAASKYADEMATQDFFSHTSKNGTTYQQRILDAGYPKNSSVGENIAAGQASLDSVMSDLLESQGHCVNIMRPQIKDVAMACAYNGDSNYKHYWVQTFGTTN